MAHEIRVLRLLCNPAKVIGFENYVVLGPKSQIEIKNLSENVLAFVYFSEILYALSIFYFRF